MRIIGIDPGPTNTAYAIVGPDGVVADTVPSEIAIGCIDPRRADIVIIEMIACYGMPVGAETFETCVWIGRYIESLSRMEIATDRLTRVDVKQTLCHRVVGVNDSVVRQRLIDLYGGKETAIGRKKTPGPLYGIAGDEWQALAVATAWKVKTNA